ncbi:MAG: 3'-5' exonuclease [Zoogloeaceae bacterium]|jgi:DNA polymerase-3 subunit epsilon|nr:3'-5' exonuclease [Zoogloeaceae bacterium]
MFERLFSALNRQRIRPEHRALFDEDDGLLVSVDCETTSLNVAQAEILSIAAVKVDMARARIHSSSAFNVLVRPEARPDGDNVRIHGLRPADVKAGLPPEEALTAFLEFLGGRTLLGYYLEYDVAMLNKYVKPLIGAKLPNRQIELSSRYYDWRLARFPNAHVDLRYDTLIAELGVPALPRHDAMNDAITVAMLHLALAARTKRPGS